MNLFIRFTILFVAVIPAKTNHIFSQKPHHEKKLISLRIATIWRVIVETVEKWEDVNDNDDPFTFNWDYYNKLYDTPKFQKAWEMIRYLNQHGVTDKLMINFMGFAPKWMGIKVIEPQYEDEYVEMIVSFFYYAIKTKYLKFGFRPVSQIITNTAKALVWMGNNMPASSKN